MCNLFGSNHEEGILTHQVDIYAVIYCTAVLRFLMFTVLDVTYVVKQE